MSQGVVGREQELVAVERFLDAAGQGSAVLVLEGEAGIGKTTLWREALRRAEDREYRVLSCRPAAAEAKLSFAGIADLLSGVDEELLGTLPEPQREGLAVALLRAAPRARAQFSRAVGAGLLSVLRSLATQQPLLIAVDDWQWLDLASKRAVEFAARRVERECVGLLCSIRSSASGGPPAGVLDDERGRRVVLGPLSLAAVGRIVRDRVGQTLPRPLLVRILQASGGNPFYALEVATLVAHRGLRSIGESELPVPDDLRKLTTDRIQRLPAQAREAVLLAAVLAAPDGGVVDVEALAPAEEMGIVNVDEGGRIEFVHPLFASAAYGSVPTARRQALHRHAAQLVPDPEQRARHLAMSSSRADASLALELDGAAARAARRGAPDAAAELAELAARRTPAADAGARGERLLKAARSHFDAGDLARAEALIGEVLESSTSDPLRARALRLAAHLCGHRHSYTRARELAAAALELAGGDPVLGADIELELTYFTAGLGDLFAGVQHAQAAADHARAVGDNAVLAAALGCLAMVTFITGRGRDDREFARILALGDPVEVPLVVRPRYLDGVMHLWVGDLDGSLERLGRLRDEAVQRGQEAEVPMLLLYMVQANVWRGDLGEAGRLATEAREAASVLDDPTATAVALGANALVHAFDGRDELTRTEAQEALALFEELQWRAAAIWPLWALGLLELSEGNHSGVDAVLGVLSQQVVAIGAADPSFFLFVPDEIEALVALGQFERAEEYLQPFERSAVELDRAWAVAMAQRCRGMLGAARGQPEDALVAFDRALRAHELAGMPFERARTLLVAGQTYRRFKRRGQARAALEEALAVFDRVGAPLWARKARDELARVGRRAPEDELTATERRVAELAASGLSNHDIAQRAFLSVKTVEANLTRVYRKLDVRSRVELANALRADA